MNLTRYRPHLMATLALGLPLIGANIARMAIGITDTVMVGWYGVVPLAALVLAQSLFLILFMLGSGYAIALMGTIATAMARGEDSEVRRGTRMALWLSVMHTVVIAPLMWWSGPILLGLGQLPEIAALTQDYLRIMVFAMVPVLWGMVLNSYLAALGRAGAVMWITLAGLPVNAALNWALIFGHWGAPALGVRGSAYASLTVNMLQLLAMLGFALWLPAARRHRLMQRFWRPDWPALRQTFRIGLPIGLAIVAEVGMFTGTNIMMGWIGAVELAAHGVALQITSVAFMVHLGLSQAATIRAGHFMGTADRAGMARAARMVIALSLVMAVLTAAAYVGFSPAIVGLYLDATNPQAGAILGVAVVLMMWAAAFQIVDGLQVVFQGLLRGVQDTRVPLVMAVIGYWIVGLPAAYVFAFVVGVGPAGLWIGLMCGLTASSLMLGLRFWRGLGRGDWTRHAAPR